MIYGNHDLATRFLHHLPRDPEIHGASVAVAGPGHPGGTAVCGIGVPTDHTFLLGSVGKAFNGLIYSGMVAEGTVHPGDVLGRFLPLQGSAAGEVTLESLLTHTSGLPATGGRWRSNLRMQGRLIAGRDPQPEGTDHLIGQLRRVRPTPGQFQYSNLGGSALGHALAAAAGMPYPRLVQQRLATPLGTRTLHVPTAGLGNGPSDAVGLSVFNRRQQPWTGTGYAPAGGIRASAEDMAIVLDALLNHPQAGWEEAFRPLQRVDPGSFIGPGNSIGAGWFIQDPVGDTPTLIWHNGYAGGFASVIVLDRGSGRGAAVSVIDGTMQADPVPVALALLRE